MACFATSFTNALMSARVLNSSAMVSVWNFCSAWLMVVLSFCLGRMSSCDSVWLTCCAACVSCGEVCDDEKRSERWLLRLVTFVQMLRSM